jgi:chemotaxis methyl-accepting protein methylase
MSQVAIASITECLTDRQFKSIVELIEGHVGIQLPPSKRTMVEGRLRKRVRALGLRHLDDYGRHLFEKGTLENELPHLIDCVTTNKTDFFREPAHFDFLRQTAVPRLLGHGAGSQFKVWSAACSIGAEAYTIAMVLQDLKRTMPRFQFSILGTDISHEVLGKARAAIYPEAMMEPVPATMRQRYVMSSRDPGQQEARIVPELRRSAQFHRLNLMDATYPFDREVDVIFCRNVLIYFDKPTQRAVIERLASHLRPGGYLILGHSESMAGGGGLGLSQVLPAIFQA